MGADAQGEGGGIKVSPVQSFLVGSCVRAIETGEEELVMEARISTPGSGCTYMTMNLSTGWYHARDGEELAAIDRREGEVLKWLPSESETKQEASAPGFDSELKRLISRVENLEESLDSLFFLVECSGAHRESLAERISAAEEKIDGLLRSVSEIEKRASELDYQQNKHHGPQGLEPCALCGGAPWVPSAGALNKFIVVCRTCKASTIEGRSRERAVAAWNEQQYSILERAQSDGA